jgi:RNA polymerase sigma-70 factor (ECF subfamily)
MGVSTQDREELERQIRAACDGGDFRGAATAAIRGYGPELFGFLVGFHRTEEDASEVFSVVAEAVWAGLDRFDWKCSFRTWSYVIARNASMRYRKHERRHARGRVSLEDAADVSRLTAQARSDTASYLRSETKSRVAALREGLSVEERMLLSLRVDRELSWNDIGRVMHGEEPLDDEALRREAARMRKRFQAVKAKLAEHARREGLLHER